ncbi:MAG: DNA-directed RNA polymerase subunit alpha C-terminal domain-containing protein [Planctomycetota bacterium]
MTPDLGVDPLSVLDGTLDATAVAAFRRNAFRSVHEIERLRDWLATPMARGIKRGMTLWALGRHAEAAPLLDEHKASPAVAICLAQSLAAIGRTEDAIAVLAQRNTDATQASTALHVLERAGEHTRFAAMFAEVGKSLSEADRSYFEGRLHEFDGDALGAIARYDEALGRDPAHPDALFRLALNVDLRGEDEEARELYERALMHPPVNVSCVINLGVLYEDMGNFRRAMQCFDLALQAQPTNPRARLYRRDAAAALSMYYDEDQERREDKKNKVLRTPINDFELSVRSRNCLQKMGVFTLGDLVRKSEQELLSYKNFGETSLEEIKQILRAKGLRLGMAPEELASTAIEETEEAPAPVSEAPDPEHPDPKRRPVTELDLSVRSRRIVDILKIKTIGDLANKTEAELLACPNFGQTSLNEIRTKLDEHGLSLRS